MPELRIYVNGRLEDRHRFSFPDDVYRATVPLTFEEPGDYEIYVEACRDDGTCFKSNTVTIHVRAPIIEYRVSIDVSPREIRAGESTNVYVRVERIVK